MCATGRYVISVTLLETRFRLHENTKLLVCENQFSKRPSSISLIRQVWIAYPSAPNNPSGNADNLRNNYLDLQTVVEASWRNQQANGYWAVETQQYAGNILLDSLSVGLPLSE